MTTGDAFLAGFFGPGNGIEWAWLQSPAGERWRARLSPFLDLYAAHQSDAQGIAVLPRVTTDGTLRWYVLSRSAAAARQAWELVEAYLGASYSDLGERSELSAADPIDAHIRGTFGTHCFSVRVEATAGERETVRARLLQMAAALRAHPRRAATERPAVGRVLRAFEQALDERDEVAADSCLDELRSGGQVDAVNLAFLELRRDGALERWGEMLARPDLLALLDVGVPRKVAAVLIRAVFATELARFEPGLEGAAAVAHFRADVEPRFRPLYHTRAALTGYEVDVQFLLVAAIRGQLHDVSVDGLLAGYDPVSPRHRFLASIARSGPADTDAPPTLSVGPPPGENALLAGARHAFAVGDIDAAFAAAVAAPPSAERAAWMLRWAHEMDVASALAAALTAHEGLPTDVRCAAETSLRIRRLLDAVRSRLGLPTAPTATAPAPAVLPRPVTDWASWLQRLTFDEEWAGAVAAASQGETLWRLDALAGDPDAVAAARNALRATLPSWAVIALHDALPSLVGAWLGLGTAPALRALYAGLWERVLDSEIRSATAAAAVVRLVGALLELSQTAATYAELVDRTAAYLQVLEPRVARSVALEALEYLVDMHCPDVVARRRFAARVEMIMLSASAPRDALKADLLRMLRLDVGGEAAATAPTAADSSWAVLRDHHVALFSPHTPALERAEALLRTHGAGTAVSTFGEGAGGSAALRETARTADVFVVAWGCLGHPASAIIADNRPAARPALPAAGRGSGALLAALYRWLGKRA